MAAMIAGIDGIVRSGQRLGEPRIAAGMLGEPMSDLHRRLGRTVRQPGIDEETAPSAAVSVKVLLCTVGRPGAG